MVIAKDTIAGALNGILAGDGSFSEGLSNNSFCHYGCPFRWNISVTGAAVAHTIAMADRLHAVLESWLEAV